MMQNTQSHESSWLIFALMTALCWGLYGVFLHNGQLAMGDPVHGRYKAFLCVGLAYFLTAVLAPLGLLIAQGASWSYPLKGFAWSLLAGALGAVGALGVLLAFGAKGPPAVVMSIVFAGAPVINAVTSLLLHPPHSRLPLPFIVGLIMAAAGGCLVTLYKPAPPRPAVVQPVTSAAGATTNASSNPVR